MIRKGVLVERLIRRREVQVLVVEVEIRREVEVVHYTSYNTIALLDPSAKKELNTSFHRHTC